MTMRMLDFTMHDKRVILTRQLLLKEQFRDARARQLATLHFLTGTKEIYKRICAEMMENGILKKDDPAMLAFSFTAPITALIHYCDREPGKEPEIMQQMEAFVKHFIKTYERIADETGSYQIYTDKDGKPIDAAYREITEKYSSEIADIVAAANDVWK